MEMKKKGKREWQKRKVENRKWKLKNRKWKLETGKKTSLSAGSKIRLQKNSIFRFSFAFSAISVQCLIYFS